MKASKRTVFRPENNALLYFSNTDLIAISDSMLAEHDSIHTKGPDELLLLAEKLNEVDESFAFNFWQAITV